MRKLCHGLCFATMVMLVACGGDDGSSADDLGELSSSSEVDIIESCVAEESLSSSSEAAVSSVSEGSLSNSSEATVSSVSEVSPSSSSAAIVSSVSEVSSSSCSEAAVSSVSESSSSNSSEATVSSASEVSSSSSSEAAVSSVSQASSSSSSKTAVSSVSHVSSSSSSKAKSSSSVSGKSSSSDASIYNATASTLTDLRDGQVYRTTTIDIPAKNYSEVWMATNLNYETANSYCYSNSTKDCTKFGRLYTWAASVGKTEDECGYGKKCSLGSGNIRGVCPKGWHIPSKSEWEELLAAVGGSDVAGKVLKSKNSWHSASGIENTDAYSFSALPAGGRYGGGNFYDRDTYTHFWNSTEGNASYAYTMELYYTTDEAKIRPFYKDYAFSIRCLKN